MRVVTVAGDPELEARLVEQLKLSRDAELVLRCMDRVEVLGAIRGGTLDAVVIVGDPVWFDAQCARDAAAAGIRLVALAPDPLAAERMRRLGAAALVADASLDDILEAARGAVATGVALPEEPAPRGSLCAIWGPKGSPGRSTIAFELAHVLAALEPDTLLVDADTYGGDLMQMAGVDDGLGNIVWGSRLAAKSELDSRALARELRRTSAGGPVLMPGIPRSDLWPEVSAYGWSELLKGVRSAFRFVVCDVGFSLEEGPNAYPEDGEGRNRLSRSTLEAADHVVAVVRADPVGIKNFVWAFESLKELVDATDVLVVANRVRADEAREVSDLVKRYAGKRPTALIPDDPTRFSDALARAEAVTTRKAGSPIAAPMEALAAAVGGSIPSRGFLARLGGRGR